ncbi:MAG: hypothetical protein HKO65_18490 [Gemmatimonadetes bacterium]|nr:hypothetical protein [Gemmatimonadota bacterium]NNM07087.1 hypothetical protein [Gemmatimonadota bacterium]
MKLLLMALTGLLVYPAPQSVLELEAEKVASAWSEETVGLLEDLLAEGGILLHLPDEEHIKIRPRQARAAISSFLGRYGTGETSVTRVSLSGEPAERGFAEITWRTSSPGLSEPVIFTLFVAFLNADDRWTVTEIRVLFR